MTGAPGTGKTYNVRSYVNDQIKTNNDRSEFVQFHPSYDYSDFIEGLRPAIIFNAANDKPTFVKQDGIFKAFCRKVIMNNFKELEMLYQYLLKILKINILMQKKIINLKQNTFLSLMR
ncbi:hypothetical protein NWQ33_01020 [Mycoplasmopsis cynos]|nr:hypothetical protein [Mycoplasmopsis cynos]